MYPEIVRSYIKYCTIRNKNNQEKSNILDLTDYTWLYPTTLLPVLCFRTKHSLTPVFHSDVDGYVEAILNPSPHTVRQRSYVPFGELPHARNNRNEVLDDVMRFVDTNYGGIRALDYLLTELTDNIYQHSEFNNAFLFAQSYSQKNYTEICFLDDGLTIPGNFSKYNLEYDNDADAVLQAVNGTSTKDEFNHRGWGLNTIVDMFTDADGEIFIASRNGAIFIDYTNKTKPLLYPLGQNYRMEGTLVSLRIPKVNVDINPYLYHGRD